MVLALTIGGETGSIEDSMQIQYEVSIAGSEESVVSSTVREENLFEKDRLGSAFKLSVQENPL